MSHEGDHNDWYGGSFGGFMSPEPDDTDASAGVAHPATQPYEGYSFATGHDAGPMHHVDAVMGRDPDKTLSYYATGQQFQLADHAAELVLPRETTSPYLLTEDGWELSAPPALPIDQYPMQMPGFDNTTVAPQNLTGEQDHAGNRVPSISLGSPLLNQEHCDDNLSSGHELRYVQGQSFQHLHTAVEPWNHVSVVGSAPNGSTVHSNSIFYGSQSAELSASDASQDGSRWGLALTPEDARITISSFKSSQDQLGDSLATLKAPAEPSDMVNGPQQRSIESSNSSYNVSSLSRDQSDSHMVAFDGISRLVML
jgi:hypothetical protein